MKTAIRILDQKARNEDFDLSLHCYEVCELVGWFFFILNKVQSIIDKSNIVLHCDGDQEIPE